MATFFLDPVDKDNDLWGTNAAANIDDGIREPTSTGFTGGVCVAGENDDNEEQIWTFGTATETGTLTAVSQWVRYSANADALAIEGDLYVGGSSQGLTSHGTPTANTWSEITWTGLSIAITNGVTAFKSSLKVGAIAKGENGPSAEEVYLLCTYTAGGGALLRHPLRMIIHNLGR